MEILLALYISSLPASIITNLYLVQKRYNDAKKENYRNLVYRKNLSYVSKSLINDIKKDNIRDLWFSFYHSIIPIINIDYTISSILDNDNDKKDVMEKIEQTIYNVNMEEDIDRLENVTLLNSIRLKLILDDDIKKRLNDIDFRLSKKETKKILKLNKLNYDEELEKFRLKYDLKR